MSEQQDMIKFKEILEKYTKGNAFATKLAEDYLCVAHIWDDLYDQDKEVSPTQLNMAFLRALGNIPQNPYFRNNIHEFTVLSILTALTWQVANRFENGNEDKLIGSFILRNTLLILVYFIILLCGASANDESWGIELGEQFFSDMFQGYHDKYKFFLSEMEKKK